MNINLFDLTALSYSVLSAYYFSKCNFGLSPETISMLGRTVYGSNPDVIENLAEQSVFNKAGFLILIFSVVIQFLSFSISIDITSFNILIFALFFSVSILLIGKLSRKLINKSIEQTKIIIESRRKQT